LQIAYSYYLKVSFCNECIVFFVFCRVNRFILLHYLLFHCEFAQNLRVYVLGLKYARKIYNLTFVISLAQV